MSVFAEAKLADLVTRAQAWWRDVIGEISTTDAEDLASLVVLLNDTRAAERQRCVGCLSRALDRIPKVWRTLGVTALVRGARASIEAGDEL